MQPKIQSWTSRFHNSWQKYAVLAAGLLPILGLLAILPDYTLTRLELVAWASTLALFTLAALLASRSRARRWGSHMALAATTAWLALGLGLALTMILVGALLALAGLYGERKTLRFDEILSGAQWVALGGLPLIAAALIYRALDGRLPLRQVASDHLIALLLALMSAYVTVLVLETLLQAASNGSPLTINWQQPEERQRIIVSGLFLPLSVALALVLHNLDEGTFFVLMLLIAVQAWHTAQMQRAHAALARRLAGIDVSHDLKHVFAADLSLDEMLIKIQQRFQTDFPTAIFGLALYEQQTEMLDFPLVFQNGQRQEWPRIRLQTGPLQTIIRQQEPLHLSAEQLVQAGHMGIDSTQLPAGRLAFFGAPLTDQGQTVGVLMLFDDKPFDPEEMGWIAALAPQFGLSVRRAAENQRRDELIDNLSLINQSVRDVLFNLDSQDAMRVACQTAMTITGAHRAAVFTLNAEKQGFEIVQAQSLAPEQDGAMQQLPYDAELFDTQAYVISDLQRTDRNDILTQRFIEAKTFAACACVPLRSGNTPIGLLCVFHQEPHYYSPMLLDLLETFASLITATLDNAELFQALERYAFELALLVHLSRASVASLELEHLAQNLGKIFCQTMDVSRTTIALNNAKNNQLQILGVAHMDEEIESDARPARVEFAEWRALTEQTPPTSADFQADNPELSPELAAFMKANNDAWLGLMPIVVEGQITGAVILSNNETRSFTEREWQLMEAATNQVAMQLHNAQIYHSTLRALDDRLEQLALIEDIARQISGALDFNEIIGDVLEAALRTTQADLASLALLTDADEFYVIGREYVNRQMHKYYNFVGHDFGVIGRVAQERHITLIEQNAEVPYYAPPPTNLAQYHSSLAVPIVRDNEVAAVLNVESTRPNFFTEEQAAFLRNLGDHAIISIDNARLVEERDFRIAMLTTLRELSLELSTTTESLPTAETVLDTALNLVESSTGALFRYDANNNLSLLVNRSPEVGDALNIFPMEVALRVIEADDTFVVEDIRVESAEEEGLNAILHDQGFRSVIAIPIRRDNRIQEVLCVAFTDRWRLQERDFSGLELLASQAAEHITNATLHEQILSTNNRMRAILDSTREGVIMMDRNGALIQVNAYAERLLGINLEQHTGEYFAKVLFDYVRQRADTDSEYDHDELEEMARLIRANPERILRRQFIRKMPNHTYHIEEVGSPVHDANRDVIGRLLTLRDITEEKNLEIYRDEITEMAVHDLRGPLGSIIEGITIVLDSLDDPENLVVVENVLRLTLDSANRLLRLVDSILDIAKLEKQEMPLQRQGTELDSLAEGAFSALAAMIDQAGIKVLREVPPSLPRVDVDGDKIQRVIINLLDNALRHTPKGGEIMIDAKVLSGNYRLQVRISDSGPGIPPEERSHVFDKFTQVADNVVLRGSKGSGLGLTFCKLTVEAHGGRIWVEDEGPLPGACIAFTLPLATQAVSSSAAP